MEKCESCQLPAETKYIEFHENIGMVFMRKHRSVKGNFCKPCIDYYFWNLTGKTMLVGWWGTISFIITPFILLSNVIRFIFTIGMEKPPLQITPSPSLLWVLSAIGGFLFSGLLLSVFLFSMIFSLFTRDTYLQPSTPTPISQLVYSQPLVSTGIPPTLASTSIPPTANPKDLHLTTGPACIDWDKVTAQMAGSEICACGVMGGFKQDASTHQTSFYFGRTDQLYLRIDSLELSLEGKCACIMGLVQLDSSKTPYIIIKNNFGLCP